MNSTPRITVLMPVYNGERYLRDAIESILNQTYRDFEFLIIDDGSNDTSPEIIASYLDGRIRCVRNEANLKLIATLNKGLGLARGEYIARMDCDDISLPERLAKQISYLDTHPEVGICGTWVQTIGEMSGNVYEYPSNPDDLRCRLLFNCLLAHPSVMMRRSSLLEHNLSYDPSYLHAEDYRFWQEASRYFALANIPEVLLFYRIQQNSISRKNQQAQLETVRRIDRDALSRLGISASEQMLDIHHRLRNEKFESNIELVLLVGDYLSQLLLQNRKTRTYPIIPFESMLAQFWFSTCNAATSNGLKIINTFHSMPAGKNMKGISKVAYSKFIIRALAGL